MKFKIYVLEPHLIEVSFAVPEASLRKPRVPVHLLPDDARCREELLLAGFLIQPEVAVAHPVVVETVVTIVPVLDGAVLLNDHVFDLATDPFDILLVPRQLVCGLIAPVERVLLVGYRLVDAALDEGVRRPCQIRVPYRVALDNRNTGE